MQLENLNFEFNELLEQYKNTIQQLSLLNINDKQMVSLQSREIIGGNVIASETLPSVNSCEALCSSNINCSAAIYNSLSDSCIITSGDIKSGNISISSSDSSITSILSQKNYLILQLKTINDGLYNILNKSSNLVKQFSPQSNEQIRQLNILNNQLHVKSRLLVEQQAEIAKINLDYKNLENEYNISSLSVNKAHLTYMIWSILTIIIVIFLIKLIMNNK